MNSDHSDATETLEPIVLDEVAEADEMPGAEASADETPADETDEREAPGRRRSRLVALGIAAVLVLGGSGAAVAAAHKSVVLDVDGTSTTISTFAGDVGNVLEAQGVTVGEHDLVVPGVDEPLTEGAEIVYRSAEQIEVVIDGESRLIWTVGDTTAAALAGLAASGREAQVDASRGTDRPALELPLVADGPATFAVDGTTRTVAISGVADLSTALLQAEITVDADDRVAVSVGADGIPLVTITRIELASMVSTEPIPFESVETPTDDLYEGQDRVVTEGVEGVLTITAMNRTVDGVVVSSRLGSSVVTTEPVDQVVEVGTKERPAPSSGGGAVVTGDVWAALAQCESGGNPATNTGNGYYGLYQFSLGTWRSVGGSGLPSEASAAEQTRLAQALQARSGWGQWPACSSKLGLR